MDRKLIIKGLKEERRELTSRLQAVQLALEAYGVEPTARRAPRRNSAAKADALTKLRATAQVLDRRGGPWSRTQLFELSDLSVNGTSQRALLQIVDEGLLVKAGRMYNLPNGVAPAEELRIRAGEGVIPR